MKRQRHCQRLSPLLSFLFFQWQLQILVATLLASSPVTAFYMDRVHRSTFTEAPGMWEDVPVVLEEFLDVSECEEWWQHISTRSRNEPVQVHGDSSSSQQLMPLRRAVTHILQSSSHATPLSATSLGSSCSTDQLPLYDRLDALFTEDDTDDTMDWLSACFGRHVPLYDTLTIEGEGSSATPISSHPFTQMILCLQGDSLIRVMPPNPWMRLCSTSLDRLAWEGFPVSFGNQLHVGQQKHHKDSLSLFALRHQDVQLDDEDEEEYDDDPYGPLQEWAEEATLLHPNFAIPTNQDDDNDDDDAWHSSVLLPGDVVVIPPGWWYQTYSTNQAVCVQSQRCGGSEMGCHLVQHVLEQAGISSKLLLQNYLESENVDGAAVYSSERYYTVTEAQELVDALFETLEDHYDNNDDDDDDDTTSESQFPQKNKLEW
ncbi:expressed unknown protein [Seminavis robusta]|uniref:JmjC domain-containing protein n=1 Tax=Seminavis robusta TaxID=568900 RepID=A0A9N8DIL4_9STRA|nr:expressed unknown protein [Seminavis robusta]|eukprot:Sro162_g072830.1 n/a (429) ;mRNA; r:41091-42377